ncbi:glycosyltransferase [Burkholderia cepacia]|uniref:glycosyltransferase n=1 Tax=Burkholderia cepacia TaxID=292 RepID=UPI002AB692E7|nr:glycosyltransferase [Burkholderia cepacia]
MLAAFSMRIPSSPIALRFRLYQMKNIELSLIVPVFNGARYLREFVRSLDHQNVDALEIIMVDDGSTDRSAAMLDEIAAADARVVVLRQANAGASVARNVALRVARGRWIAFADCDDWLVPGALGAWLARAKTAQADVLVGNGFAFDDAPQARVPTSLFRRQPWGRTMSGWAWIRHAVSAGEWPHYVWLQLVRRDFLVRHRLSFEEGILHQDIVWTVALALTNGRFVFMRDLHYGYRRNPASVTNDQSREALWKRAQSYVRVLECIVGAARQPDIDVSVRRALMRQVNHESRHFHGLLRAKIKDSGLRNCLAQRFLSLGLHRAVLLGARWPQDFWHALRCTVALRHYVKGAVKIDPAPR